MPTHAARAHTHRRDARTAALPRPCSRRACCFRHSPAASPRSTSASRRRAGWLAGRRPRCSQRSCTRRSRRRAPAALASRVPALTFRPRAPAALASRVPALACRPHCSQRPNTRRLHLRASATLAGRVPALTSTLGLVMAARAVRAYKVFDKMDREVKHALCGSKRPAVRPRHH